MVGKPLCPLYKNIIKPLDRARYPELRYGIWLKSDNSEVRNLFQVAMYSTFDKKD